MKKWKIFFIILIVISPFIYFCSYIAYGLLTIPGALAGVQSSLIVALILYKQFCFCPHPENGAIRICPDPEAQFGPCPIEEGQTC